MTRACFNHNENDNNHTIHGITNEGLMSFITGDRAQSGNTRDAQIVIPIDAIINMSALEIGDLVLEMAQKLEPIRQYEIVENVEHQIGNPNYHQDYSSYLQKLLLLSDFPEKIRLQAKLQVLIDVHNKPRKINKPKRRSKHNLIMQRLIDVYGSKCLKCGSIDNLVIDHVVPRIKGGSPNIKNLQILCSRCNREKYTDAIDYRFDEGMGFHE